MLRRNKRPRKSFFVVSAIVVAVGAAALAFRGFNWQAAEIALPASAAAAASDAHDDRTLAAEALLTDPLNVDAVDRHKTAWPSEVFNDQASAQLKAVAKILAHPRDITEQAVQKFCDDEFQATRLRPESLVEVYADGPWQIRRPSDADSSSSSSTSPSPADRGGGLERRGASALAAALRELMAPLADAREIHAAFKIVRVDLTNEVATTVAVVQIDGQLASGRIQQNGEWRCRWRRSVSDGKSPRGRPRLLSIDSAAEKYEEASYQNAGAEPAGLFVDVTRRVTAGDETFDAQFGPRDANYWMARLESAYGVDLTAPHGIAVGDVNGDLREDVYVCQPGGLPNRLFVAQPDGSVVDQAGLWGVDFCDFTRHALWIDFDNDGDQDLVALINVEAVFFENDGQTLTPRYRHVVHSNRTSLAAADFDNDGLVDVYVLNEDAAPIGSEARGVFGTPIPYYDANNGGENILLRNEGRDNDEGGADQWIAFRDVTAEVGLDQNNKRFTLAAAWDDFDRDGDADLYVANDFGRNNLYRNDNGRFVDVAAQAGVEDASSGMSVSWGDYNDDGLMDLYVSNMFSSAGNRVTYQRSYDRLNRGAGRDEGDLDLIRRHARGNSLFENRGDGTFRDVSVETNVTLGRWAWASNFIDFNNDGRQDLLVANGFITNEVVDDL